MTFSIMSPAVHRQIEAQIKNSTDPLYHRRLLALAAWEAWRADGYPFNRPAKFYGREIDWDLAEKEFFRHVADWWWPIQIKPQPLVIIGGVV